MNTDLSSGNPSTLSSGSAHNSTIRPRNRRLVSIDDDSSNQLRGSGSPGSLLEAGFQSRHPSRAVSPIPSKHPSRSVSLSNSPQRSSGRDRRPLRGLHSGGDQATPTTFATGLWETSWTSLQSIASNLLGNETTKGMKDRPRGTWQLPRRTLPSYMQHRRAVSSVPPTEWGPVAAGDRQVGVGTREERQALVKAKKRETLLEANGHVFPDSNGRFKRRVSEDRGSMLAPPTEHEDRDALVYIHHVQPDDTLAGVMIKYNCQPAVFRKANRLWPNDSIQMRKIVVLPVDACGVKGRKVLEPERQNPPFLGCDTIESTLANGSNVDGTWGDTNTTASPPPQSSAAASHTTSPSLSSSHHDDPPWKHDSWVRIDPYPAAIEIARLPRRTLGFFPPSRRKSLSNSYSDLDTPPASLDLPRPQHVLTSPTCHDRRRRKSRSSSGSYFAHPHHLHGPGGVGTLERNASPGPAQDGLNKLFAAHLPNVAPRSSFESTTSTSSAAGGGGGIENVGGAIEGWVRKLATRAATIIEPQPGLGSGVGDLIELSDAFELGDEDSGGGAGGCEQHVAAGVGSARAEGTQEHGLRERFPPRGRLGSELAKGKKGV